MSKQAERILRRKLALESRAQIVFRTLFANIAFRNIDHHKEIRSALVEHYGIVFDSFIDDYRDQHLVTMAPLQEALLAIEVKGLIDERASKQSGIISGTIDKMRLKVNEEVRRLNPKPNNPVRVSNNMMYSNLLRKVNTIVCYETQWAAETARFAEIVYLTGLSGITIKANKPVTKRWDAMGDDKMRRWHADADSQVVRMEEPFTVNGELLMRPGDTSLGATPSNIINCRCSVTYGVDFAELTTAMGGRVEAISPTGNHVDAVNKLAGRIDEALGMSNSDAISKELMDIRVKIYDLLGDDGKIPNVKDYDKLAKRVQVIRKQLKDSGIVKPPKVIKPPAKTIKPKPKDIVPPTTTKPKMIDLGDGLLVPEGTSPEEIIRMLTAHQKEKMAPNFIDDPLEAIKKAKAEIAEHIPTNLTNIGSDFALMGLRDKLIELNGAGTKGTSQKIKIKFASSFDSRSAERVDNRIREVYRIMFEQGLVNQKMVPNAIKTVEISVKRFGRAFANVHKNFIQLFKSDGPSVVAHELAHHIEARNPFLEKRMLKWRDDRINKAKRNGEKAIRRSSTEIMWEDGFHDPYVGRVYSFGATEVLSTGVEALFDVRRFDLMIKKDPDHFYLVWAALRGY